ncbi:MAG TPA: hypothetical protein VLA96_09060 [Terriglobales bacterium]|nr:hypothetical protein [Terriglobales bacterium]
MMYWTLFDVSTAKSLTALYLVGIIAAPCVVAIAVLVYRSEGQERGWRTGFFLVWSILTTFLVWIYCGGSLWQYYAAKRSLRTGDYSVAEGIVSNFKQGGDHKTESFVLGSHHFEYGCCGGSYETFTSDYNPGARTIHDGVRARITYRGDTILKVEVE